MTVMVSTDVSGVVVAAGMIIVAVSWLWSRAHAPESAIGGRGEGV